MSGTPSPKDAFGRLLSQLLDGDLSPDEQRELSQLLSEDEAKRRYYVRFMALHAQLLTRCAPPVLPPEFKLDGSLDPDLLDDLPSIAPEPRAPSGPPPLVIESFRDVLDAMLRPLPFTLIILTMSMLPLLLLLVVRSAPEEATIVARIGGMHGAVWVNESMPLPSGTQLLPGERIELKEGLVEILFTDGAKVLLEGPVAFDATSAGKGRLRSGRLVAQVPKGAEGFAVATPSATVVDLGTEFGVSVEAEQATADVEVFEGKVELQAGTKETPVRQLVKAGQAVRVESAVSRQSAVRQLASSAVAFVRQLPPPPPKQEILARFSGGAGNAQPDQFPGTAGDGWETAWSLGDSAELRSAATVEQANALLDGGDYLRVLVQRKPDAGGGTAHTAVERRFRMTERVDMTRPHVFTFNLRIDSLGRFGERQDRLSICSRSVSQEEFGREGLPTSGWHICRVGGNRSIAKSGNWVFLHRNANGRADSLDSGVPASEGNVYSFRILVDPRAGQWTPSIAVNGGVATSFAPMGMRSKGTPEENGYWPFLHMFCVLEGGNAGGDVEKIGFSVDSIEIRPQ